MARRETAASASASEQRFALLATGCLEIFVDSLPCLLGELEFNEVIRLFFSHNRPIDRVAARSDILNHVADKVAAVQLAIHGKIEKGEIALAILDLNPHSYGPDMLGLERRLGADQLSFVTGLALVGREHGFDEC